MPFYAFLIAAAFTFLPTPAHAGEIVADSIQRDPYGMIQAEGDVHFTTQGVDVRASEVHFDVDSQAADMVDAKVKTTDGQLLYGKHLKRIDLETFEGEDVVYTLCPEDDLAWAIVASSAKMDGDAGTFTAKHARFEWAGVPVLYTPYWSHALTRRTGFLMPNISNSARRGTQIDIPFYWAAAPDWDMTFTPRLMSLRGTMADIEWRHRSAAGKEVLQWQGIRDSATGENRGSLYTDMGWRLSSSIDAALNINAVSDGLYIADYALSGGELVTAAYLTSSAHMTWRDESDSVILSSRYQQVLGGASNAGTLQVLPRLKTRNYFSVADEQTIQLDHETTLFQRDTGVSGLRTGLRPSWSLPWQMQGGAVSATWSILGQGVAYESQSFTETSSSYGALASSLQVEAIFEKVFADQKWRHEMKPIIRFDVSSAAEQSLNPRYDSSLLPLNLSNLLRGNRYSGWDRFERMRRVSFLLAQALQTKENMQVRNVLEVQLGMAYDALQETVDAAIAPAATRAASNVLTEFIWYPLQAWRVNAGGQFHTPSHRWVESHGGMAWREQGQYVDASWRRTEASYSQEAESVTLSGKLNISQRWTTDTFNQYDLLRKRVIQTRLGLAYHHACWDFSLQGYKTYQVGSNSLTDIGWRFLLTFDGLGSFGGT
ncbi:MAG: LPS assembly protein LptD [Ghiorsea sp.]|nr:LPS assembly protein LptD [Ghiorsea sp.]